MSRMSAALQPRRVVHLERTDVTPHSTDVTTKSTRPFTSQTIPFRATQHDVLDRTLCHCVLFW